MAKLISRSIRQMVRVTFVYRRCEPPLARWFVPVRSVLLQTQRSRDAGNRSDPSERIHARGLGVMLIKLESKFAINVTRVCCYSRWVSPRCKVSESSLGECK
jgi:hypothetical protein